MFDRLLLGFDPEALEDQFNELINYIKPLSRKEVQDGCRDIKKGSRGITKQHLCARRRADRGEQNK